MSKTKNQETPKAVSEETKPVEEQMDAEILRKQELETIKAENEKMLAEMEAQKKMLEQQREAYEAEKAAEAERLAEAEAKKQEAIAKNLEYAESLLKMNQSKAPVAQLNAAAEDKLFQETRRKEDMEREWQEKKNPEPKVEIFRTTRGRRLLHYRDPNGILMNILFENGVFATAKEVEKEVILDHIEREKLSNSDRTLYTSEEWANVFTPDKVFMEVEYDGETKKFHQKQLQKALDFALAHGFEIPEVQIFDKQFRGGLVVGTQQQSSQLI